VLALLSACATAHVEQKQPAASLVASQPAASRPSPIVDVSGVWAWHNREKRRASGVVLVEDETWHLTQTGTSITGYYQRAVTWTSDDGNPFSCNQALDLSEGTRYQVSGTVSAEGMTLDEIAASPVPATPTSCDDGSRPLRHYTGRLGTDGHLTLSFDGGAQTLTRAVGQAALDPMPASQPASTEADAYDGVWHWRQRSRDSDGDIKIEHEVWHLEHRGDLYVGFYDRTVDVHSADHHLYACDAAPSFESQTRYLVSGALLSDGELELEETLAEPSPSPCDNDQRTLGSYHGRIDDGQLLLFWSQGHEALVRGAR
jgi:hypothetical protein